MNRTEISRQHARAVCGSEVHQRAANWGNNFNGWRISKEGFGSRAMRGDDYMIRAAAAVNGVYGNDAVEALYPMASEDEGGRPLDGRNINTR